MDNNVCFFIPKTNTHETVHTVNFVLERKFRPKRELETPFLHTVYCVLEGEGLLHLKDSSIALKKGDVFFTLPSIPFNIETVKDFEYAYVTYLGTRASEFAEKFHVKENNFVFRGLVDLPELWLNSFKLGTKFSDLISESLVLYTFAQIGNKFYSSESTNRQNSSPPLIKKYIDEHFSDSDLSLKKISEAFSYNPKYISSVFKKEYEIGISDYLNTVRIQHACDLIERGLTAVNDIGFLCGYNDPLYFSKVFKSKIGISPKAYVKKQNQR